MSQNNGRESFANMPSHDANVRESDANDDANWLTVTEAAQVLGVSARTVQKRAEAGKLTSKQDGRRLLVYVPVPPVNTEESRKSLREAFANTEVDNAKVRESEDSIREHDANLLVEQLRSEIALLTEQLRVKDEQIERRDVAESELRRLMLADRQELQQLRQKVALLIAPPVVEEPSAVTVQETPQAAQEDRTAPVSADMVNSRQDGETGVESTAETIKSKRWFEFWKR